MLRNTNANQDKVLDDFWALQSPQDRFEYENGKDTGKMPFAFSCYIDQLHRDGIISDSLADSIVLETNY